MLANRFFLVFRKSRPEPDPWVLGIYPDRPGSTQVVTVICGIYFILFTYTRKNSESSILNSILSLFLIIRPKEKRHETHVSILMGTVRKIFSIDVIICLFTYAIEFPSKF